MKQRLLFMSIFDLTVLQHAIADKLIDRGFEVLWVTTSEKWTDWLVIHGVPRIDILQLIYQPGEKVKGKVREQIIKEIVETEKSVDLNINQVLLMDQFVARRSKSEVYEIVLLYYRDIKKFVVERGINIVFAEATNTNELITYMLSKSNGIPFLVPSDMRHPLGRVVFFEGYRQSEILGRNPKRVNISGREIIEYFREKQTTPYYFSLNTKETSFKPDKLIKSIGNRLRNMKYSKSNLTHHDLKGRITHAFTRSINSFLLKNNFDYVDIDKVKGRLAYYGLHVQPESSIDVQGSYFSDQVKLIKDIRRALPFDCTLLVKDHPNFLGTRPLSENRQIANLPGVKLVHHNISSFDIYKRCSIVFTVSGTTAYEAGLFGIPAVVFAPMFFDGLSSVFYCPDLLELKPMVDRLLSHFESDIDADSNFMEALISKSFEVDWSNPISLPKVMEKENVKRLAQAFETVILQSANQDNSEIIRERVDGEPF